MDQYRLDMENELKKSPINDSAILAFAEKVVARHTRYVEKTQKSKRLRLGYAGVLFVVLIAIAVTSNPLSKTIFHHSTSSVFSSQEKETHNITISVSGLPSNLTVVVWGGSNQLAKFQSNQPIQQLDVPSNLNKIKLELESYSLTGGARYVTEQSQYDLKGTEDLQVNFKKQYQLGLGVALTGGNFGGSEDVLNNVKFSPASKDGFYDAGTTVTATAPNGRGILFGYWVIKDSSNGSVNSDVREFSSAENPLKVTVDHPTYLFGRFVGEWKKLKDKKEINGKTINGIVVKNLVKGQKVKILQNGNSILEKRVEVETADGPEINLPIGSAKLSDVQIVITAPDGETVIFESPIYAEIQPGDQFFY